tara:strand:- start:491 stop:724 length:234 start_codon:yes stop_codon:yes gene_type:complete
MFDIDENLKYIILLFILSSYLIYQLKLDIMFHKDGKFKDFGTGSNKTLFPFWLVILSSSSLIYIYIKSKNDDFINSI